MVALSRKSHPAARCLCERRAAHPASATQYRVPVPAEDAPPSSGTNDPRSRDEFSAKTKNALAARVGWRCSEPGCRKLTIGPKQGEPTESQTTGIAAHITAAAKGGPRFDASLSSDQRKDISNGIWLCLMHARVIDTDHLNYSVTTLRQWRQLAEAATHAELTGPPNHFPEPRTLVGFGLGLVTEAIWRGGERDFFTFDVESFACGDAAALRDFIHAGANDATRFITVESQGDGRIITGPMTWAQHDRFMRVTVPVAPRPPRRNPHDAGQDLALGEHGDLFLEDGDLATVQGVEASIQTLFLVLSSNRGEWVLDLGFGSRWRELAERYSSDLGLLSRLFLLEVARLISVPEAGEDGPSLEFVERVLELEVLALDLPGNSARVRLTVLWASSGERWTIERGFHLSPRRPPFDLEMRPSRRNNHP